MQTIYILRHFKVNDHANKRLDSKEFQEWIEKYDNSELEYKDLEIPQVDKVYTSSLKRAVKTVQYLKLQSNPTSLLNEVLTYPFVNTKYKLPKELWLFINRIFWFFNLTSKERKIDTINKSRKFFDQLEKEKLNRVLIVSHGLFLKIFLKELKKNGFRGKIDQRIKNGKIYTFTR